MSASGRAEATAPATRADGLRGACLHTSPAVCLYWMREIRARSILSALCHYKHQARTQSCTASLVATVSVKPPGLRTDGSWTTEPELLPSCPAPEPRFWPRLRGINRCSPPPRVFLLCQLGTRG